MAELKRQELDCGCVMGPDGFITAMCLPCEIDYIDFVTDAWERARLEAAQ